MATPWHHDFKRRPGLLPKMRYLVSVLVALAAVTLVPARGSYPVQRPPRSTPPPPESSFTVHPDQAQQVIKGLGFEIQSDSIGSGNEGLPEATTSVPHDLTAGERARLGREMLAGFRYCRLAGGLYWRGLDPEQKVLRPRWPEQLDELRGLIRAAGVEGVEFEYWSPAPFWKANRQYTARKANDPENRLRCFGQAFAGDPDYHGDVDRFLGDFAAACRADLQTLKDAGIPVVFWGLQNEPFANVPYPSCVYRPQDYVRTFTAVAPVIRAFDPKIRIVADTDTTWRFHYIRAVLDHPETTAFVDDLVMHHIGNDSRDEFPPPEPSGKPRFNDEYEYLGGAASPARCLNTVQDIMNWFQVAHAPTWFWLHALKPVTHSEASGYALGFWQPIAAAGPIRSGPYQGLRPGHWTWNNFNWFAVGSFVRHMPWDCQAVEVTEEKVDQDLRILAFRRPDGKLTVVLSNRSFAPHTFHVVTGLEGATFKGYRYTPSDAGAECRGVELPALTGGTISPELDDLSWEFWEQQ